MTQQAGHPYTIDMDNNAGMGALEMIDYIVMEWGMEYSDASKAVRKAEDEGMASIALGHGDTGMIFRYGNAPHTYTWATTWGTFHTP